MYKRGQRVRITQVASTPWWNFLPDEKEKLQNKIFKLIDDLGVAGGSHGWQIETPFGRRIFTEDQFRALKKKDEVKAAAKVPVISLKGEVHWLNKVKKNFENAGSVYSPQDEITAPRNRYGNDIGLLRDVFRTPPQPTTTAIANRQGLIIQTIDGTPNWGVDEMADGHAENADDNGEGN
jgi:hypothetical protein